MSTVTVHCFTLTGTDLELASITAMTTKLGLKFRLPDGTYRIRQTAVEFLPPDKMPTYAPGKPARGFYKSGPPKILMNNEIGRYQVAKTFAHEAMHALDQDWLEKGQRSEIKETMAPEPAGWDSEIYATYASAAIGDFTNPPYTDIYAKRVIPAVLWDLVEKISLRDDRPPKVVDCSECEKALTDVAAQLADQKRINADLLSALSVAKGYAQQIETHAASIDTLAKQIEAL